MGELKSIQFDWDGKDDQLGVVKNYGTFILINLIHVNHPKPLFRSLTCLSGWKMISNLMKLKLSFCFKIKGVFRDILQEKYLKRCNRGWWWVVRSVLLKIPCKFAFLDLLVHTIAWFMDASLNTFRIFWLLWDFYILNPLNSWFTSWF